MTTNDYYGGWSSTTAATTTSTYTDNTVYYTVDSHTGRPVRDEQRSPPMKKEQLRRIRQREAIELKRLKRLGLDPESLELKRLREAEERRARERERRRQLELRDEMILGYRRTDIMSQPVIMDQTEFDAVIHYDKMMIDRQDEDACYFDRIGL